MSIIADIYAPKIPTLYTQIPHARVIGSFQCSQFNDFRTAEFLIDSGASFTTLLPYHVIALDIDWENLANARTPCMIANGEPIYAKLLPDVELHINRNDGKPKSEEIFVLPYIHVIPVPMRQRIPVSASLLGMDVLRNFPNWHWDFDNMYLTLSR